MPAFSGPYTPDSGGEAAQKEEEQEFEMRLGPRKTAVFVVWALLWDGCT